MWFCADPWAIDPVCACVVMKELESVSPHLEAAADRAEKVTIPPAKVAKIKL